MIMTSCLSFFVTTMVMLQADGGKLCRSCSDSLSPEACTSLEICGQEEICYTREYTDDNGRKAYRLGCESKQICKMYDNVLNIFGRRDSDGPPTFCFECCDTPQCNADVCSDRGSTGKAQITTRLPTTRSTKLSTVATTPLLTTARRYTAGPLPVTYDLCQYMGGRNCYDNYHATEKMCPGICGKK